MERGWAEEFFLFSISVSFTKHELSPFLVIWKATGEEGSRGPLHKFIKPRRLASAVNGTWVWGEEREGQPSPDQWHTLYEAKKKKKKAQTKRHPTSF